jgi:hypothetical protein
MPDMLLVPCNGIGNPLSTISRYAGFRAAELLTEQGAAVELVALGRLLARLAEAVAAVREYPVAVIEGCPARCASKLLDRLEAGDQVVVYVFVPHVMEQVQIGRRGLDRKFLGPKGWALVEAVAGAATAKIIGYLRRQGSRL